MVKNFSKIQIYCCLDKNSIDESNDGDYSFEKLTDLRNEMIQIDKQHSSLLEEFTNVKKELPNKELQLCNENTFNEIQKYEKMIRNLESSDSNVETTVVEDFMKLRTTIQKEITIRSKICKNLVLLIKDVSSGNINDLLEEIGFENVEV
ncbi:hypothetical protein Kpol_1032p62 [Vanderwaltozyma polyspora DSM 70294]|uniref:Uncharacterized protein n=1 Tax=Vanderwaltozyma polyspora (strain ATCC 22028 / DSM 70294 / BCRC 21397 / CBS 2163 / NBRC 10782 / NRRL Y-8283 / UCD 57-17) TaxID=436907 RepID=A7TH16_VANPO|nr:uncharacterized protein Kpol_1032p62 [Vanderwaltozyma polyspora DSM 70294]EDO18468.1 hypothetical protein Kpol_1032p62 [Vanderwaltozyma polyspora DSM 70294]